MNINDFIEADLLATFWGLVLATTLIVQFTKSIIKDKLDDVYVRLYTFIIALILSFVFTNQGQGVQGIFLIVINAMTISIGAMGAYEVVIDPYAEKEKGEDKNE